ncbi:MAG: hypothetical protein LBV03_03000 [Fusobacteriales bacterium]|nr:hypothetical protein [Fusobacteriales bacterium]
MEMNMKSILQLLSGYLINPSEATGEQITAMTSLRATDYERSCFRGMAVGHIREEAGRKGYIEIVTKLFKKSINTLRDDSKRYQLYVLADERGKKLVNQLKMHVIKRILKLGKTNAEELNKVLKMMSSKEMTPKELERYLNDNVRKEESLYLKAEEIPESVNNFLKRLNRKETALIGAFLNLLKVKKIGMEVLIRIYEKISDIKDMKKISKRKRRKLRTEIGIYF